MKYPGPRMCFFGGEHVIFFFFIIRLYVPKLSFLKPILLLKNFLHSFSALLPRLQTKHLKLNHLLFPRAAIAKWK